MATEFWISQPKLNKIAHNSDHMHHTFLFCCYSGAFVIGDFKFVTEVFKGRCHGNQTMNLLHKFGKNLVVYTAYSIFLNLLVAQVSSISVVLLKFTREVAMATEFWISQPKLHKIGHNSDHMHHTLIFFCYSGVFVVNDFKLVT